MPCKASPRALSFSSCKIKVDYIKGAPSFVSPYAILVQFNEDNKSAVEAKNVIIATGSEVTPFPGGGSSNSKSRLNIQNRSSCSPRVGSRGPP